MIPYTPTPMPVGTPIPLNMGGELTLWQYAPDVVGIWGQFDDFTPGLQWGLIIIVGLVLIAAIAIQLRNLTEDEA